MISILFYGYRPVVFSTIVQ